jgi:predicted tellurium resistance membrane protein TerC
MRPALLLLSAAVCLAVCLVMGAAYALARFEARHPCVRYSAEDEFLGFVTDAMVPIYGKVCLERKE